jgi:Rps23 Pro-64 3,4-dihydroxylase Tpa1-like proline 4-hydroxylase
LLEILESERFREFVSTVTGVDDLLLDPTRKFAGAHRTPPGGFTKIHRDFEKHPTSGLFHRVNLLVYLNRDWPDSYGGSLELWPSDMSAIGRRIFPRHNTMVLWETHGATLHGLPDPVSCPSDRMRLSVACYYYTKAPRVGAPGERRVRYWAARPGEDRSIERMSWQDHVLK